MEKQGFVACSPLGKPDFGITWCSIKMCETTGLDWQQSWAQKCLCYLSVPVHCLKTKNIVACFLEKIDFSQ